MSTSRCLLNGKKLGWHRNCIQLRSVTTSAYLFPTYLSNLQQNVIRALRDATMLYLGHCRVVSTIVDSRHAPPLILSCPCLSRLFSTRRLTRSPTAMSCAILLQYHRRLAGIFGNRTLLLSCQKTSWLDLCRGFLCDTMLILTKSWPRPSFLKKSSGYRSQRTKTSTRHSGWHHHLGRYVYNYKSRLHRNHPSDPFIGLSR